MLAQAKASKAVQLLGVCLVGLAWGLPALAQADDGAEQYANSVEKDLSSLEGEWQGQASSGTKIAVHFAAAHGTVPLTGKLKIEGGSFAGETELSVLHAGSFYFLVPEASPFTPLTPGNKEPYGMMRAAGGGFRFTRLARVEVGNQAAVQAEQILIGKKHADGSRTIKLASSEKFCADPANPAGKVCGDAITEQVVLHKVATP